MIFFVLASFIAFAFSSSSIPLKRATAPNVNFSEFPWIVLILGGGVNNTVLHTCTGSILDQGAGSRGATILTSAFCVRPRPDPDSEGSALVYKVLVETPSGDITLLGQNFTQFGIDEVILHPQAGTLRDYMFTTRFPNGTTLDINANIDINDIAIVKLEGPINVQGVGKGELSGMRPAVGEYVGILSYGAPNFFYLTRTLNTAVVPSFEVQSGALSANINQLFIQDRRLGRSANTSEAAEAGDEGAPMINSDGAIVGVVQGSWRINLDGTSFPAATIGPLIRSALSFIDSNVDRNFVAIPEVEEDPPSPVPPPETTTGAPPSPTPPPPTPTPPPSNSGFGLTVPLVCAILISLFTQ